MACGFLGAILHSAAAAMTGLGYPAWQRFCRAGEGGAFVDLRLFKMLFIPLLCKPKSANCIQNDRSDFKVGCLQRRAYCFLESCTNKSIQRVWWSANYRLELRGSVLSRVWAGGHTVSLCDEAKCFSPFHRFHGLHTSADSSTTFLQFISCSCSDAPPGQYTLIYRYKARKEQNVKLGRGNKKITAWDPRIYKDL